MKMQNILLVFILATSGCATTHLPKLGETTSPEGIPAITDPTWAISSEWPSQIRNGNLTYHKTYIFHGKTSSTSRIHTTNFSKVDLSQNYWIKYEISNNEESDDYPSYGPFFGWHPDGSLFFMGMWDEAGNSEFHNLYPNGTSYFIMTYNIKKDITTSSYYDRSGKRVGYKVARHSIGDNHDSETKYSWSGRPVSELEYYEKSIGFRNKIHEYIEHNQCMDSTSANAQSSCRMVTRRAARP